MHPLVIRLQGPSKVGKTFFGKHLFNLACNEGRSVKTVFENVSKGKLAEMIAENPTISVWIIEENDPHA